MDPAPSRFLILVAGTLRCALPLAQVREVMRVLPINQIGGLPYGVLGASIVHGAAMPVVSLPSLLNQPDAELTRFVVLRSSGRGCILAVTGIDSISMLDPDNWQELPKLLDRIEYAGQLAALDAELTFNLDVARILNAADQAILPPVPVQ
jgi:purine-binding chemotaxis protein CheW